MKEERDQRLGNSVSLFFTASQPSLGVAFHKKDHEQLKLTYCLTRIFFIAVK